MFLLVLAFSFLAAQIVMKNREVFADDDCLVESEGYECEEDIGILEEIQTDKDIFTIESGEIWKIRKAEQDRKKSKSWLQKVDIKESIFSKIRNYMPEKIIKLP